MSEELEGEMFKRGEDYKILAEIRSELQSLNQTLRETVNPRLQHLENCVFGENMKGGLIEEVRETRSEIVSHEKQHKVFYAVTVGVAGAFATGIEFMFRIFKK